MSFLSKLFHRISRDEEYYYMDEDAYNKEEYDEANTSEQEPRLHGNTSEAASESDEPEEQEYEIVEREILPAKIICPDCGGITLEGLDFCDKCGGELQ